jgi:hypothetical protein
MMDLAPAIRMKAIYTAALTGIDSVDYPNLYLYKSESGNTTVFEFVPSIRWNVLRDGDGQFSISPQVGAGLFYIRSSASAVGRYGPLTTTVKLGDAEEFKPGFQAGVSVVLKNRLEIMPLWTFVFTGADRRTFYLISLGLVL